MLRQKLGHVLLLCVAVFAQSARARPATAAHGHLLETNHQIESAEVFGDQLVVVREAISTPSRLPDSPALTNNVRGYLITARLSSDGKTDRRVIGPIYHLGLMSAMANDVGAIFNKKDRRDLASKPFLRFDRDGNLTKLVPEGDDIQHWVLQIGKDKAHWVKSIKLPELPLVNFLSDTPHFDSISSRFAVQMEAGGRAGVYDRQTARRVDDAWLESVAADLFSREDLKNSHIDLTDDLEYLVATPNDRWQDFTEFNIEGKTYSRASSGIFYARPEKAPVPFLRSEGGRTPLTVFSINKQLRFLAFSAKELRLLNSRMEKESEYQFEKPCARLDSNTVHVSLDQQAERLIFTSQEPIILDTPDEHDVHVLIWYYNKKQVSEFTVSIRDLFDLKKDGFYPKESIPVEDR